MEIDRYITATPLNLERITKSASGRCANTDPVLTKLAHRWCKLADHDPTTRPSTTQIEPKRQRGHGRIFPRKGSPFLWCAYYLRGRQYRESTGETDPQKAQRFLNRRMKEVGAEQIGARAFAGPQQDRVLVNELLDDLEVDYKMGGKRRIPREISPQMRSHLKRVRDYFGEMRANTQEMSERANSQKMKPNFCSQLCLATWRTPPTLLMREDLARARSSSCAGPTLWRMRSVYQQTIQRTESREPLH